MVRSSIHLFRFCLIYISKLSIGVGATSKECQQKHSGLEGKSNRAWGHGQWAMNPWMIYMAYANWPTLITWAHAQTRMQLAPGWCSTTWCPEWNALAPSREQWHPLAKMKNRGADCLAGIQHQFKIQLQNTELVAWRGGGWGLIWIWFVMGWNALFDLTWPRLSICSRSCHSLISSIDFLDSLDGLWQSSPANIGIGPWMDLT